MQTFKYSEGPWHLGKNGDDCARNHAICSGSMVIAKVYGRGYPITEGWSAESEADARLMAAAPKMLATLRSIARWCSNPSNEKTTSDFEGELFEVIGEATESEAA